MDVRLKTDFFLLVGYVILRLVMVPLKYKVAGMWS